MGAGTDVPIETADVVLFIYRYPTPGELESPALRERQGPVHGGPR
jgi:hypothetical protein